MLSWVCDVHPSCVCMDLCFLLFLFVCLHVCAYAFKFKIHCGSAFEPGASGLHHYCTSPVCVPDVIGALAVWRQNTNKTKNSVVHCGSAFEPGASGLPYYCTPPVVLGKQCLPRGGFICTIR